MKKNKRINLRIIILTLTLVLLLLMSGMPLQVQAVAEDQIVPAATYDDSRVPEVKASSVVLMDAGTGEIIYRKNADEVREPASITKVLNLLVVLDVLDMDRMVEVPYGIETVGTVIKLQPGEKLSVRDLIYGMMLESGNDAAELLGETAGEGSLDKFAEMMNRKAREYGATDTDFSNPNGLNDDKNRLNYTTAMDMATVGREAMKNPQFREIVGTSKYTIGETNRSEARKLYNSNYCLWDTKHTVELQGKKVPLKYDGCNGIKTGMTSSAGTCLLGSARRGNTELILVVLNSDTELTRFTDAMSLWDYGFANYKTYTAAKSDRFVYEEKVRRGSLEAVNLGIKDDLKITVNKDYNASENIRTEVRLDREKAFAPVRKGEARGVLLARNEKGSIVGESVLYALEDVGEGGILSYIGVADESVPVFLAVAGAGLVVLIIIVLVIRHGQRRRG